jgi:hypothetical protein
MLVDIHSKASEKTRSKLKGCGVEKQSRRSYGTDWWRKIYVHFISDPAF